MKKLTLLTATALSVATLGSQSIVANAASCTPGTQSVVTTVASCAPDSQNNRLTLCQNGARVMVSYGSFCNIQELFNQLEECLPCFPSGSLPGVNCPETDAPDADTPDADAPDTEAPDTNAPEVNVPENDNSSNNGTEDTTPEEAPEEDSSDDSVHAYVKEVIDLVNAERAKEGLDALTMDLQVQAAAQVRATECEQLFSHTRPDGSSFATALKEQNVSYRRAGENIAWGQRTPQEVVTGWMNSEGHRANIMSADFTKIGVGYYQNANGTNYWCQLFTN